MTVDSHIPPRGALSLFLRLGGWILLACVLPIIVLSQISISLDRLATRFEANGVSTQALVTHRHIEVSTDSDGDKTRTYWFDLEFVLENGTPYAREKSVPVSLYDATQEGETLEVIYLRDDPNRLQMYAGEHQGTSRVIQIIALVLALIWLVAFWLVGRKTVAGLRARLYGERVEVPSEGLVSTNVTVNNQHRHRLAWRMPDGTKGKSLMRARDKFDGAEEAGASITVYKGLRGDWWAGDVGNRPDHSG